MKSLNRSPLALALFLAASLVACGDDDPGQTPAPTGVGGAGATTTTTSTTSTSTTSTTTSTANAGGAGGQGGAGGAGGQGGAGGGNVSACGIPQNDACGTCVVGQCDAVACECVSEIGCLALAECLSQCQADETDCIFPCFGDDPEWISEVGLFADCIGTECADAGGQCAGSPTLDGCARCTLTECEAAFEACNADEACNALLECAAGCEPGDTACQGVCGIQNPQGVNLAQDVQTCLEEKCADAGCPNVGN